MSRRDDVKRLRRIYASVPDVGCKGLCQECCGPMACSTLERGLIEEATGSPFPEGDHARCPFLEQGRCAIYAVRPAICRLWGAVPEMRCPHGCKPTLDSASGRQVLRDVARLSGGESNAIHITLIQCCAPQTGEVKG